MGQKHKSYYLFNNLAGNTTIHDLFEEGCSRQMCWDEENRLAGFSDHCKNTGFYQYDAGGKRTYKLTGGYAAQNIQGHWWSYNLLDNPTLYASSYVVATPQGYTKPYYAEAERITSQLGKGQFADVGTPMVSNSLVQVKLHLHYLPWGETYVDQKSNRFDGVRYTFSAKEKDAETGYSYFGARYYSSDLSVWLSVDPMARKYPSTSPYAYCRNKPIILVDPNGMFDRKSRAQRVWDRAAKRYGEDRVSDVFNNTIDGGKANYAFRIYGEGKTKYSYGGGTNDQGGPVITCDKPDKVVFKRRDFRDYKESFTMAGYYREQISKSSGVDKFGYRLKLAGEKVHFDEQNFVDGAGPYLQGIVLANPLVGVPNDIKTVFSGYDIYGNQSSTFSRVVSGIDALSLVGLSIKLFDVTLPKGFEKALNATNKTTTIYSVGSTINDQKSGTKKGGGDE